MDPDHIVIEGAREHNLQGITVRIPRGRLVVVSGVSGSGKSSLAFDTLFAEGQRRYVESLSAYARQFLGQLEKPRYDSIHGLTPTIAIEQKSVSHNPRSTVGTMTEVHDFLRVLFARVGVQHCHLCGRPVSRQEPSQIVHDILQRVDTTRRTRAIILAPLVRNRKGEFKDLFDSLRAQGFARVRVDGKVLAISDVPGLRRNRKHDIDLVVDRLVLREGIEPRLTDSVETALHAGKGQVAVDIEGMGEQVYSEHMACPYCQVSFPELSPQLFSFNSPVGACQACTGIGSSMEADPDKLVPDYGLSIEDGAVEPLARAPLGPGMNQPLLLSMCRERGIPVDKPFGELSEQERDWVLYGDTALHLLQWGLNRSLAWRSRFRYEGIANYIARRYRETRSIEMRTYYQRYMSERPCSSCGGKRLRPEALAVKVADYGIAELSEMPLSKLLEVIRSMQVPQDKKAVFEELRKELASRLRLLVDLGVGYLALSRPASTLSGGEAQRIRLAGQLGSELTGVTYVLDEPSIGLHPRDNRMLVDTLKRLRDLGNTVVVVEHDRDAILSADHVIEFGPGAGRQGGRVVFEGRPSEMLASPESLTGAYLSGRKEIPVPRARRTPKAMLRLLGASGNNLKNVDVTFPLGTMVVVTGVSGAGKSTLVTETLCPALQRALNGSRVKPLPFGTLEGVEHLDKIVIIDQQPIGRTPRSNPATYTKVFDHIRVLFAATPEARVYGFKPGRFSFNVKGGRCEKCQGAGVLRVEMHFLPDMYVRCQECKGKRFNEATLRVKFKGLTIADVLEMSVDEAMGIFENHGAIRRILQTLHDVGLGYLSLGQPSPTLSGGEAQRIKLARELSKVATGRTLYVLDEPTTGLHMDDIRHLLGVLDRLVSRGNTVVMIEHNVDVMKHADYIIDLGPEGGEQGGHVVAWGRPEDVARVPQSHTGRVLREVLDVRGMQVSKEAAL